MGKRVRVAFTLEFENVKKLLEATSSDTISDAVIFVKGEGAETLAEYFNGIGCPCTIKKINWWWIVAKKKGGTLSEFCHEWGMILLIVGGAASYTMLPEDMADPIGTLLLASAVLFWLGEISRPKRRRKRKR
jgi:hypothetical protein